MSSIPHINPNIKGLDPTPEELATMTPEELRLNDTMAHQLVFGANYTRDRQGKPIEQGHGSPGHETAQSRAALEREAARRKLIAALP